MSLPILRLKKGEDRRIRSGHPWIFSNEINTTLTPLKSFKPGSLVNVQAHDGTPLGSAYINPHSLIAARIYSRLPDVLLDAPFFAERIQQALQFRSHYFDQPYYRLVFSEADLIPGLVIDRFGDTLVLQMNTAGIDSHKAAVLSALQTLIPEIKSVLLRNDSAIRKQEGLALDVEIGYGEPAEETTLIENQVSFYVPLLKGQKTGWFYDHRNNRLRLSSYVNNNTTVLDVFSYLGGWGIQAAVFGAKQVDCIEASEYACNYIAKNASLNNVSDRVNTICDDAFDALKKLVQEKRAYDVIILDPPAFVKKSKDKKEGTIAYQRLNELALKLLQPGGILFSCSCSMHMSMEDLVTTIQRAATRCNTQIQILERGHQGVDHPLHPSIPETDYLKAVIIRKMA